MKLPWEKNFRYWIKNDLTLGARIWKGSPAQNVPQDKTPLIFIHHKLSHFPVYYAAWRTSSLPIPPPPSFPDATLHQLLPAGPLSAPRRAPDCAGGRSRTNSAAPLALWKMTRARPDKLHFSIITSNYSRYFLRCGQRQGGVVSGCCVGGLFVLKWRAVVSYYGCCITPQRKVKGGGDDGRGDIGIGEWRRGGVNTDCLHISYQYESPPMASLHILGDKL